MLKANEAMANAVELSKEASQAQRVKFENALKFQSVNTVCQNISQQQN